MLLLWPGTSTQNIYKATEGSHFFDEEVEYLIDNFSGQYFTHGCFGGGVDIGTGNSQLLTSKFRFSDQYKKICASAMSNCAVFGHGDKLNWYDYNSSTVEKELDSKTMSRSSEEFSSFSTGVESTYWEASINSHCSSASTTAISSYAMPANIGVSIAGNYNSEIKLSHKGKTELQLWVQNLHLNNGRSVIHNFFYKKKSQKPRENVGKSPASNVWAAVFKNTDFS